MCWVLRPERGVLLLALAAAGPLAGAQTLGELVERAKQARSPVVSPPPPAPKPAVRRDLPRRPAAVLQASLAPPKPPLLWSISGVEDQLEAVLLMDGKAVTVRADGPARVGPWQVHAITPQGVWLSHGAQASAPQIRLEPPAPGASALPHYQELTRAAAAPPAPPAPAALPAAPVVPGPIAGPASAASTRAGRPAFDRVIPNVLEDRKEEAAP